MSSPRFCSECGKPLEAGHRFCTNCGATTSVEANARTALTSDQTVLDNDQAQSSQPQVSVPLDKSSATASTDHYSECKYSWSKSNYAWFLASYV